MKLKNKIATSTAILSLYPVHEAVDILGKTGYDAIEIWAEMLDIQLKSDQTSMQQIKEALERHSMTGVIHAPLKDLSVPEPYKYNICSKDAKLREKSIQENLKALGFAHELGFDVVTVHPGHIDRPEENVDMDYWQLQIDAFKKLAKRAEELGVRIGMEPMEHRPREFVMEPKHVDKIIQAVQSPNLGVTFDLIHAYTHGTEKPVEFLDGLHKNIFHVHMSGHSDKKNHVPFSMTIIHHFYLDKVINKLVGNGYSGIISIEGTLKGVMEETGENQKKTVKENLEYIYRELKSLHLL